MSKKPFRIVVAVLSGVMVLALTRPLFASEEMRAVSAHSNCTGESTWQLTMNPDIGIETEVHLETGVPDQNWTVAMAYRGKAFFHTVETTEDDGGFEVKHAIRDDPGLDQLQFKAVNQSTGEVCTGGLEALFR